MCARTYTHIHIWAFCYETQCISYCRLIGRKSEKYCSKSRKKYLGVFRIINIMRLEIVRLEYILKGGVLRSNTGNISIVGRIVQVNQQGMVETLDFILSTTGSY